MIGADERTSRDASIDEQLDPGGGPPRVAYQGVAGAYGDEAIHRLWRGRARAHPARTFSAALDALQRGAVDWAVIPIWNSTIGRVAPACAALDEHTATVVRAREMDVPVRHCLLALPGTLIADVRFVGSHPAALAQCTHLFERPRAFIPCEAFDTAGAARELSRFSDRAELAEAPWYARLQIDGPLRLAAIASAAAARHYGLVVLRHDVHDDPTNVTRFAVVRAREAASC